MFGKFFVNEKINGNWFISFLKLEVYGCGERCLGCDGIVVCWINYLVCGCCFGRFCLGLGNNSNGLDFVINNGWDIVGGCCGFWGVCELVVNDFVNWKDDSSFVINRGCDIGIGLLL